MSGKVSRERRVLAMKLARIDGYAGRAAANPFACPRLARIYARERAAIERRGIAEGQGGQHG